MKDTQKYEIILLALAEVINLKNNEIVLKDYVINGLKKKLEAAESAAKKDGKPSNIERRG